MRILNVIGGGVLMSVLALGACAIDADDSKVPAELGPQCTSDSECTGEKVCRTGLCSVPGSEVREIGFRLIPPNSSSLRPQVAAPSSIELDESISLGMRPSVRVEGRLLYNDAGGVTSSGPTGTLTFRRQEPYFSGFSQQYAVEEDSTYSILVLPGSYDVTFTPDDERVPGQIWQGLDFRLDTNPQLTLPARSQRVKIAVIDLPGPDRNVPVNLEGARIVGISQATGATSSTTIADASLNYELALYPDSGLYDVRVSSSTETGVREVVIYDAIDCTDRCPDIVELNLAETAGPRVNTTLELTTDTTAADLHQTRVETIGRFEWGAWSQRTNLEEGQRVEIFAPAGQYDVSISPPAESTIASATRQFETTPGEFRHEFYLESKRLFESTVVSAAGEPVPGAQAEFEPVDASLRTLNAETDEEGRLNVELEPVPYWVTLVPGKGSLPRSVLYLDPDEVSSRTELRLSEPVVLSGLLATPEMDDDVEQLIPIPDVTVQAFEMRQGRVIIVGDVTTDSDGVFRMILGSSRHSSVSQN